MRKTVPYVTCRSAKGLSQVCHRSVQSYSRPIWPKTEVCKSADCLRQTSHENDCFFDCALPFILFAASLLQTFRDFWWLWNKDLFQLLMIMSALDLQQTPCRQAIQFYVKPRGNLNFCLDLYILYCRSLATLYSLVIDSTGSLICFWEEAMKVSAISQW